MAGVEGMNLFWQRFKLAGEKRLPSLSAIPSPQFGGIDQGGPSVSGRHMGHDTTVEHDRIQISSARNVAMVEAA